MNSFQKLGAILSEPKNSSKFALFTATAFAVLAVTSGTIIVPDLILNPLVDPLKVMVIGAIAILIALNLTVILNSRKTTATTALGATAGIAAGTVTTACTFCPPIIFIWLGAGTTGALFTDISIYIGIASIIFLSVALHYSLKDNCEVNQ